MTLDAMAVEGHHIYEVTDHCTKSSSGDEDTDTRDDAMEFFSNSMTHEHWGCIMWGVVGRERGDERKRGRELSYNSL